MKLRTLVTLIGAAGVLAACSGGGSGSNSLPAPQNVQQVSGTLSIGGGILASVARSPAYVSAGTHHAAVFIDGNFYAGNDTTSCTPGSCAIAWSAALTVPASHTFAVEIDTGHCIPASSARKLATCSADTMLAGSILADTILAEGQSAPTLVNFGGGNSESVVLNGVAANVGFGVTGCSNSPLPGNCTGRIAIADAATDFITYSGSAAISAGASPTSGNVFDNGGTPATGVTFMSDTPTYGTITGTAASNGSDNYETYSMGTLSVLGPDANGSDYAYTVTCASTMNTGSFGITVGGGSSTSLVNVPTTSQPYWGGAHGLTYPSGPPPTLGTAPSFTCTNGVITSASGTITVTSL